MQSKPRLNESVPQMALTFWETDISEVAYVIYTWDLQLMVDQVPSLYQVSIHPSIGKQLGNGLLASWLGGWKWWPEEVTSYGDVKWWLRPLCWVGLKRLRSWRWVEDRCETYQLTPGGEVVVMERRWGRDGCKELRESVGDLLWLLLLTKSLFWPDRFPVFFTCFSYNMLFAWPVALGWACPLFIPFWKNAWEPIPKVLLPFYWLAPP